jgi:glycerate kinase
MMRILIAPDKFKGSLDAVAVAEEIATGIREVRPEVAICSAPLADGGEGTAEVLGQALRAEWVSCRVHDPFSRMIEARYGWAAGEIALMEMSEAAGMRRVVERDPLRATTFGVGEMILDAVQRRAREIIIGLGGSATNDGGFGLARAIGFRFFAEENELTNGPAELVRLDRIDSSGVIGWPGNAERRLRFTAAVDVVNPLLGPRGATRVFGPQKGATAETLEILERGLTRLAETAKRDLGCDFGGLPGAGAAGGLGFGLMTFCGAHIRSGFDVVAEAIGLEQQVREADVVITGEGRLDGQTAEGKAPAGVAKLARRYAKRVYAIVGEANGSSDLFDRVYPLVRASVSQAEAMQRGRELLRERGRELAERELGTAI